MPNKKEYQRTKQAKIDYFSETLNITKSEGELLYSITRESGHDATKPIIKYRLKKFASKRHKTFRHIEKLYRHYLEQKASELNALVINAVLVRRSNKGNLIFQEVELIDIIESYKNLLNKGALIAKEQGHIKNLAINFYYDDLDYRNGLEDKNKLVMIENYGGYYEDRVIITKRDKKTNKNTSLEYEDISAILRAKKRQLINNNFIDALIINEL